MEYAVELNRLIELQMEGSSASPAAWATGGAPGGRGAADLPSQPDRAGGGLALHAARRPRPRPRAPRRRAPAIAPGPTPPATARAARLGD